MNTGWMKTRQTKYTAYATVYIAIIIAVLVMVNFLAQRYNKSYDSTTNKQFSLSDQTLKVVKGLQQDVQLNYYDKTSSFTDPRGNARDLLDRYANLSPKVHLNYIDPDKKPQLAKAAGVRSYGTLTVEAAGRKQEAKGVSEEEVTGALVRALKGGERNVCIVQGTGEPDTGDSGPQGTSTMKDLLERNNYKSQTVNLLRKPEVPKECSVLVVAGPRQEYVEPAVNAIKNYVQGGGRALVAIDPPLKFKNEDIAENAALMAVLTGWGVTPEKDLVIDLNPVSQVFGFSAAVVLIQKYESHAIVRDLRNSPTALPLVRSLSVKSGDKTTVEKLFETSEDSFATPNLSSGEVNPNDKNNKKGPLTVAAAGTYNTGQANNNGRFVVIGSSSWLQNNILGVRNFVNRDLYLNMLNWLSSDEDLISIRPKEPENRPLMMTGRQMRVVLYSCLLFLPLIVIGAGLSVWWRRR
jgi:ABC-type uncharacterized transport system involved in gliding motility auxiliary subunit